MAKAEQTRRQERNDDPRAFEMPTDDLDDADVEDDDELGPIPRETGPQPRGNSGFVRAARGTDPAMGLPGTSLPREGTLIAGKYRVDGVQARDTLAVTLRASHTELGQRVWVRYLLPRAVRRPDAVSRFIRRARSVAAMRSEHAARVLDVGRIRSGIPFVVLDDMNGWDLDEVVRVRGPLPVQEAVEYVLQAADALAEAHGLGIVHGSLRPSNILLARRIDDTPLIKVAGFELSDVTEDEALSENAEGTSTRGFLSTLPYRAPEQIRAAEYTDERVDVWALGAVLHTLLTGAPPFRARTASALLATISADEPRRVAEIRGDVAPDLEGLILSCLAKNPSERPLGMAELAACLTPFAPGDSMSVIDRISRAPVASHRPPPLPPTSTRAIVPVARPRTVEPPKPAPAPQPNQLLMTGVVALSASIVGAAAMLLVARASERGDTVPPALAVAPGAVAAVAPAVVAPGAAPVAVAPAAVAPAAAAPVAQMAMPQQALAPVRAALPQYPAVATVQPARYEPQPRPAPRAASTPRATDGVARSEAAGARAVAHDDTKATNTSKDLFDDTR